MPRLALLAPLTAALASAGCGCGYGGLGCGSPALLGVCDTEIAVDQWLTVTAVYGDDTGEHPADVREARATDAAVLRVLPDVDPGLVHLEGLSVGRTELELDIAGWDRVFGWVFHVEESAAVPEDCDQQSRGPDTSR